MEPDDSALLDLLAGHPDALARLVLDMLLDALPGTPSRVVSVLVETRLDTAEAARRLRRNPHYVRTNLARFARRAREQGTHDPVISLLLTILFALR